MAPQPHDSEPATSTQLESVDDEARVASSPVLPPIFTVGHSNRSFDEFADVLRSHHITAIADVRSRPYSRYLKHFGREALSASARAAGLSYVYLGSELGGMPDDPTLYRPDGTLDIPKVVSLPAFESGIQRVRRGMQRYRIALMCAEDDPLHCHRYRLLSVHLAQTGIEVLHLRRDGRLESMDDVARRSRPATKANSPGAGPQGDLFG